MQSKDSITTSTTKILMVNIRCRMKYDNYRARLKERFKSQLIAADCDCEQAFNIIYVLRNS